MQSLALTLSARNTANADANLTVILILTSTYFLDSLGSDLRKRPHKYSFAQDTLTLTLNDSPKNINRRHSVNVNMILSDETAQESDDRVSEKQATHWGLSQEQDPANS